MSEESDKLLERRGQIQEVDREIVQLLARRLQLAREVGESKAATGQPIRDFGTEKRVIERVCRYCQDLGLSEEWGKAVARLLIQGAVKVQEDLMGATPATNLHEVLVIGGAGKMGRWMARFLSTQGHAVRVHDPSLRPTDFPRVGLEACRSAEVVVIASPLAASAAVYDELRKVKPPGLIFDVCSLKEPIRPAVEAAVSEGLKVASIHPMFGAGVQLLSGRTVLVCETGHEEAVEEVIGLFEDTSLKIHRIPLDSHDRLMAVVLGLSHSLSLIGFTALAESSFRMDELLDGASTTFLKMVRTIAEVAFENPHLYYEIQNINRHTPEVFDLLQSSLDRLRKAALAPDATSFVSLMEKGRDLFEGVDFEKLPTDFGD